MEGCMESKHTVEKYVFQIIGYFFITLFAIMCLIPFLMIVIGSVTEESHIIKNGYSLIPSVLSLDAYEFIFKNPKQIVSAYQITLLVTIVGTLIGLFITAMTAYVLQRKDFKNRNVFSFYFFFTTLFSGGLVPWYILIVKYLGWKDSLLALIVPALLNVFYIIIMRSFISSTIPDAISESSEQRSFSLPRRPRLRKSHRRPVITTVPISIKCLKSILELRQLNIEITEINIRKTVREKHPDGPLRVNPYFCAWGEMDVGFQPLLKSCFFEFIMRYKHDFKGGPPQGAFPPSHPSLFCSTLSCLPLLYSLTGLRPGIRIHVFLCNTLDTWLHHSFHM